MEDEATNADHHVCYVGDEDDRIMFVDNTVPDSDVCKVYEEEVSERVDDFCRIV